MQNLKIILVTLLQNRFEYETMPSVYERPTNESHSSMTALRQPLFDTSFESRLASINLDAVMSHVAAKTGLPAADLQRAEAMYRQFLQLLARYPDISFVPPKLVDEVWDTHITFTRQYFADCDLLFGGYKHHTPHPGGAEETFEQVTVPAFAREFGINLKAYGAGFAEAADCGS